VADLKGFAIVCQGDFEAQYSDLVDDQVRAEFQVLKDAKMQFARMIEVRTAERCAQIAQEIVDGRFHDASYIVERIRKEFNLA
jgi:hypothetical protein